MKATISILGCLLLLCAATLGCGNPEDMFVENEVLVYLLFG